MITKALPLVAVPGKQARRTNGQAQGVDVGCPAGLGSPVERRRVLRNRPDLVSLLDGVSGFDARVDRQVRRPYRAVAHRVSNRYDSPPADAARKTDCSLRAGVDRTSRPVCERDSAPAGKPIVGGRGKRRYDRHGVSGGPLPHVGALGGARRRRRRQGHARKGDTQERVTTRGERKGHSPTMPAEASSRQRSSTACGYDARSLPACELGRRPTNEPRPSEHAASAQSATSHALWLTREGLCGTITGRLPCASDFACHCRKPGESFPEGEARQLRSPRGWLPVMAPGCALAHRQPITRGKPHRSLATCGERTSHGNRYHASAPRVRCPLRSPDSPLEPEDEALHPHRAQRHLHH